jgi:hypothetical protein
VQFFIDGSLPAAMQGDTLARGDARHGAHRAHVRVRPGRRAGFCLMGACQDCWVWTEQGERLRACSTEVSAGHVASLRRMEGGMA